MSGDTISLGKILEADRVSYICSRFNRTGITISEGLAEDICSRVECYSSYVQRLDFTSKLLYLSKNLIKGKKLCAGISPAAAKACSAQVLCNFATGYPAVR